MADYDAYAQDYDRLVTSGVPVIELAYQWVLEQAGEVAGKAVLDLGCGQGELSRRLCRLGAAVTGADASSAQLAVARERAAGWSGSGRRRAPSAGGFDLVVCSLVLMDVPDFQAAFAAAARVLAPGGSMLWVIMHPCFQAPHSEALADAEGRLHHRRIAEYASGLAVGAPRNAAGDAGRPPPHACRVHQRLSGVRLPPGPPGRTAGAARRAAAARPALPPHHPAGAVRCGDQDLTGPLPQPPAAVRDQPGPSPCRRWMHTPRRLPPVGGVVVGEVIAAHCPGRCGRSGAAPLPSAPPSPGRPTPPPHGRRRPPAHS